MACEEYPFDGSEEYGLGLSRVVNDGSAGAEELCLDLGTVEAVDKPIGVTWLSFNGLALTDYTGDKFGTVEESGLHHVPVATSDLAGVVHRDPRPNDQFWTVVNLAATSMADVKPNEFDYEPPLNTEDIRDLYR